MQEKNKKNTIKTLSLGCRLNALETEKIKSMLQTVLDTAVVVNTCAVTAEAERQSGQIVRKITRENPSAPVFVTGCAATRNPDLFSHISTAMVIDNQNKLNLNAYTDAVAASLCKFNTPVIENFNHPAPQLSKQYIQVQNGCNHKCAYCVTRLLRGPAKSFEYETILSDALTATKNGFQEIVLTGVDTASYAYNGMLVSDICKKLLHDVPGIKRLRISSLDPASPQIFKIIDLIKQDSRMMPHIHLSMQSGSDTILKSMRRRHTSDIIRRIALYAGSDITFSWDIICGFPGETDKLFQETLNLVHETKPIKIHAFPFSARPGTEAFDMPNQINKSVAKKRVKIISDIADEYRAEFMHKNIGQSVPVLVEEHNIARTPHDITVKIQGAKIPSRTICNVKLTDINDDAYIGLSE